MSRTVHIVHGIMADVLAPFLLFLLFILLLLLLFLLFILLLLLLFLLLHSALPKSTQLGRALLL